MAFRLLPPLSPSLRARRLLDLSLRDLRRLAIGPFPPRPEAWQGRFYGRLEALPDQAEPLQRARLLAALSVGDDVIQLRMISGLLDLGPELDAALAALAQGDTAVATKWLARLDRRLGSPPGGEPDAVLALQARARILALSEALAGHTDYFETGAAA